MYISLIKFLIKFAKIINVAKSAFFSTWLIFADKHIFILLILKFFNSFKRHSNSSSVPPYAQFISLGHNCMPRVYLTNFGIKPSKSQGELSMPFDLIYLLYESIYYYLLFDFNGFLSNLKFDYSKKCWTKGRHATFNHDADCDENSYNILKDRYEKRIENFRNAIKSDDNILFIAAQFGSKLNFNLLYEILKFIRKNKPFKLLVLDFYLTNNSHMKDIDENIHVIRIPFPFSNYIWYDKAHRNTPSAIEFEKKLKAEIEALVYPECS